MSTINKRVYGDWRSIDESNINISVDSFQTIKKSKPFLKFIPRYAIAEFFALMIGVVASLEALIFTMTIEPEITYVFLVPLIISVVGILFIIVKRP